MGRVAKEKNHRNVWHLHVTYFCCAIDINTRNLVDQLHDHLAPHQKETPSKNASKSVYIASEQLQNR